MKISIACKRVSCKQPPEWHPTLQPCALRETHKSQTVNATPRFNQSPSGLSDLLSCGSVRKRQHTDWSRWIKNACALQREVHGGQDQRGTKRNYHKWLSHFLCENKWESFLSVVEEMSGQARRESTELLSHFSAQNAECKKAAGRTTSPSVCWCNMITSLLQSDTSSPSMQCRRMRGAGKRKKAEGKNSSGMIRGINSAQQQAAAERAGHKHTNTIESLTRSNPIYLKIIRWFLPDPNE